MKNPFPLTDDQAHEYLSKALQTMITRDDLPIGKGERGRLYAWYWGYYGRAAVDLYQYTGESRFAILIEDTIDFLLGLRDDALGLEDDARHRVVPSWGTRHRNGARANEITTAGLITLPMVEYAHLTGVKWLKDEALQTLLSFRNERYSTDGGEYYFWHLTDDMVEALNHSALYGASLAHASKLTSDPWFIETALGLQRYHDRYTIHESGKLEWPYAPTPSHSAGDLPPEAIWKAAATIELPVALEECGKLPDSDAMSRLARTIYENPLIREKRLPQFIGPCKVVEADDQRVSGSLTSFIGAFLQIDNARLRESISDLMVSSPALFPNGWKGGSRSMIMAWAHLRRTGHL